MRAEDGGLDGGIELLLLAELVNIHYWWRKERGERTMVPAGAGSGGGEKAAENAGSCGVESGEH